MVLSAASVKEMNEWIAVLTEMAVPAVESNRRMSSKNRISRKFAGDIIHSGMLQKAARIKLGDADKKNRTARWQNRYFELSSDGYLRYFTRQGGVMKGSVLVTGGTVRLLLPGSKESGAAFV